MMYSFSIGDTVRTTRYLPNLFHHGGIAAGEVAVVERIDTLPNGLNIHLKNEARGAFQFDPGRSLETEAFEKV